MIAGDRSLRGRVSGRARAILRPPPSAPGSKGRIAFYGPLPPAKTGIATYDRAVLEGLDRIGARARVPMDVVWPISHRDVAQAHTYLLGVFQMGNNVEFHLDIYRLIWQVPALVVLHDLALDDFVRGLQTKGDPLGFIAAREASAMKVNLHDPDALRNEPLREPWVASVARRARGIIVHSDFCRRYLEDAGCRTPVFVVPHPAVEPQGAFVAARPRARALRAPLEAVGVRTLVVAPGDLNAAKRLDSLIKAVASLDPSVGVAFVGRRIEGFDLEPLVEVARLGDRAVIAPDVSDEDFLAWLEAADVVVDLRFPHRGEVSGSLARAMQAGKPTIVSATGTYLDVPDDAVLRVAPGPTDPGELAARIRALADDPDLRARVGASAAAHVEEQRSAEATANGYAAAIGATLELVRDPSRAVLGRWAKSLADIGVTEDLLAEGYGLAYARALESFKRTP
jgi:glycosyltransferase involved in cell wall biosynthesis